MYTFEVLWGQVCMDVSTQISGNGSHLELHHALNEVDFPSAIEQALSRYSCVIPALLDLQGASIHKKFYLMDKCIFVPREQADSRNCEGLQLFHNLKVITGKSNFCEEELGEHGCFK